MALAVGFNGHEHSIHLLQRLGVVELEHPAFLAHSVLIKDTEIDRLSVVGATPAPGLEGGAFRSRLLVELPIDKDPGLRRDFGSIGGR